MRGHLCQHFLDLAKFKERMRIDHTHEDDFCNDLLDAAEGYVSDVENGILGRPAIATEFVEEFTGFDAVSLSHPDEVSTVSIAYTDSNDASQTLADIYTIKDGSICLNDNEAFPANVGRVTVTYTAGWVAVPAQVSAACYFYAGTLYENRDAEGSMPVTLGAMVSLMLNGYRRVSI